MAMKFGNGIDLVNQKIVNVADPTSATDAVNKQYADALTRSLAWKHAVRVATTSAGTLATDFDDGTSVDGITIATGDRILIKNQAAGEENGIYVVAASGAPTRADDADTANELKGATVTVLQGTVNGDKVFRLVTDNVTLGTTSLSWTEIGGGGTTYTADGDGIELSSTTFSLELDGGTLSKSSSGLRVASGIAGAGIVFNSAALDVNTDGTTIEVSSDAVRIAAGAAGAGLTGGGGSALAVGAGTGITVNANDVALSASVAGSGLTHTAGVLDVNTGTASATGLEISSDTVRIATDAAGSGLSGGGGSALSVNTGTSSATLLEINSDAVRISADAAGAGLTGGAGSALAVGAGSGITVNANDVAVNSSVARVYAASIGDNSTTNIVVTHNLGTRDVMVTVRNASSPYEEIIVDNEATSTTTATLRFATAPTTNQYRVIVQGVGA